MCQFNQPPHLLIAGVDEAGRGPLAGPVVAAAVILNPAAPIEGLADSKKISEKRRNTLNQVIKNQSSAWSIGIASVAEIDQLNILWASMLAMQRAVAGLSIRADWVKVDGNRCPDIDIECEAIIGGDARVAEISAASIVAKVERDRLMYLLHTDYPDYGFDRHKGYPTRAHRQALYDFGVTPHHRSSFSPVNQIIEQSTPTRQQTIPQPTKATE